MFVLTDGGVTCDSAGLYHPATITTDKAHCYGKIINEMNMRHGPGYEVTHLSKKQLNNRMEGDHAVLKQIFNPMRGFQCLSSAKAALKGIATFRAIKKAEFHTAQKGVQNELNFVDRLFDLAA